MKASTAFPYHPFWLGWNPSRRPITVYPEQFGSSRWQIFGRQSRLGMKTCWAGMSSGWQRSIFTHFVSCAADAFGLSDQESWGCRRAELQGVTSPCPHSTAGSLLPLAVPTEQEEKLAWLRGGRLLFLLQRGAGANLQALGSIPFTAGMLETSAWFMDESVSILKCSDDFQASCLGRETKCLLVIS